MRRTVHRWSVTALVLCLLTGGVVSAAAEPAAAPPTSGFDESVFRLYDTVWRGGGLARTPDGTATPNNTFTRIDRSGKVVGTAGFSLRPGEFLFWATATPGWILGNACPVPLTGGGCSRPRPVLWRVDGEARLTAVPVALPTSEPAFGTLVGTRDGALLITTDTMAGVRHLNLVTPGADPRVTSIPLPDNVNPYAGVCVKRGTIFAARTAVDAAQRAVGIDVLRLAALDVSWSQVTAIAVERGSSGDVFLACGDSELGLATNGSTPRFLAVSAATGQVRVPVANPLSGQNEVVTGLDFDAGRFLVTTMRQGVNASYWTHREGEPGLIPAGSRALNGNGDLPRALLSRGAILDVAPKPDSRISQHRTAAPAEAPLDSAINTTWTHNICGALGCSEFGNPKMLDPLIFFIANQVNKGHLPLSIGIQEACQSHWELFLVFLRSQNEHYFGSGINARNVMSECGSTMPTQYGNAVFAIGGQVVLKASFIAQGSGDGDRRGRICVHSVFAYVACTAHLICPRSCGDSAAVRVRQLTEYYQDILKLAQQFRQAVYWGGDLYVTPDQMIFTFPEILNNNREADTCEDGVRPTHPGGKFDYLFRFGQPVVSECAHDAFIFDYEPHDHHLVGGFI